MRQKALRSFWKFIAAAARIALIAFPAVPFSRLRSNRCSLFMMSDAWFDCGTTFHPSPSCLRCMPSSSLVDMHGDRTVIVVASIAHIDVHCAHLVGDQALDLLHLRSQGVAVIGISSEALRADEPPTTAAHRDTHLVAKLLLLARLVLGDALHFRFMHTVDLVLVMPLLCMDLMRCRKCL